MALTRNLTLAASPGRLVRLLSDQNIVAPLVLGGQSFQISCIRRVATQGLMTLIVMSLCRYHQGQMMSRNFTDVLQRDERMMRAPITATAPLPLMQIALVIVPRKARPTAIDRWIQVRRARILASNLLPLRATQVLTAITLLVQDLMRALSLVL